MTTLDKTEIETARDEFVHSTTKEQIERWAYKWADDLLSTADALSSLPAQAAGVKPAGWQCEFFHAGPSPRWHPEAWLSDPREIYGDTLVRNVKPLYLAPSQPAAVGEAESFDDRDISILVSYERTLKAWSEDSTTPQFLREDLSRFLTWMPRIRAALVHRDQVKL